MAGIFEFMHLKAIPCSNKVRVSNAVHRFTTGSRIAYLLTLVQRSNKIVVRFRASNLQQENEEVHIPGIKRPNCLKLSGSSKTT